jgi:hypothetical protein
MYDWEGFALTVYKKQLCLSIKTNSGNSFLVIYTKKTNGFCKTPIKSKHPWELTETSMGVLLLIWSLCQ